MAAFQIRAVRSRLTVATLSPSGLKQAKTTESPCCNGAPSARRLWESNTCAVDSPLAITKRSRFGLKVTRLIRLVRPGANSGAGLATSQTRAKPSFEAVTTRRESALNSACARRLLWGRGGPIGLPVRISNTCAVCEPGAETRSLPSALKRGKVGHLPDSSTYGIG